MGNRTSSFDTTEFLTYPEENNTNPSGLHKLEAKKLSPVRRKRGYSSDSIERDDYGWFEDFESPAIQRELSMEFTQQPLQKALTLPAAVTEPPLYVLECSLETQQLWYSTAGRRPKQPQHEREYYEKLWRQNFEQSRVKYNDPYLASLKEEEKAQSENQVKEIVLDQTLEEYEMDSNKENDGTATHQIPPIFASKRIRSKSEDSLTRSKVKTHKIVGKERPSCISAKYVVNGSPGSLQLPHNQTHLDIIPKSELNGEVIFRGKSPFSNSVSKSFFDCGISSITLHMPYFRIFRGLDGDIHAEFLVKITLGGLSPVTFGIWKRHSDFSQFVEYITQLNTKSGEFNLYKNALLSWQCVLQRKRWYRSLDKDYLALKCFLIERFMHDVLFESKSPYIINRFLGLEN